MDARWLAELGPMFFSIRKVGMGGRQLQAEEDAATAGTGTILTASAPIAAPVVVGAVVVV